MNDRIIQIIPAPTDMWVKWEPTEEGENVGYSRVPCLALKDNHGFTYVVAMTVSEDDGIFDVVSEFTNFGGIIFAKDPYKKT